MIAAGADVGPCGACLTRVFTFETDSSDVAHAVGTFGQALLLEEEVIWALLIATSAEIGRAFTSCTCTVAGNTVVALLESSRGTDLETLIAHSDVVSGSALQTQLLVSDVSIISACITRSVALSADVLLIAVSSPALITAIFASRTRFSCHKEGGGSVQPARVAVVLVRATEFAGVVTLQERLVPKDVDWVFLITIVVCSHLKLLQIHVRYWVPNLLQGDRDRGYVLVHVREDSVNLEPFVFPEEIALSIERLVGFDLADNIILILGEDNLLGPLQGDDAIFTNRVLRSESDFVVRFQIEQLD